MRPRLLPLVVLALVSLAGCGSGNGGSSSSSIATISSSNVPAPQVARGFLAAAKSGRGAAACALMTERAVTKTAHYVQSTGHAGFSRSRACAVYFRAYQTNLGGALPSVEIGRVSVSGDQGKAEVVCPNCNRPRLLPLHLRKEAAGWRVDFDPRQGY
jgi:hypothetical protein